MKVSLVAGLIALVFISGCADKPVETQTGEQPAATEESVSHEHEHQEELKLNNGEKWTMPDSMRMYVRSIETNIAKAASGADDLGVSDYNELAALVEQDIEMLTQACTMEGEAHDELHKWLVPFIEKSEALKEVAETNEGKKVVDELNTALSEFNRFFE